MEIAHKFRASALSATVGSVKLSVFAVDYAGNYISVERELKGAFGQLLDALGEMWNAIWNVLVSVAKAVMNGVNVIVKWIKSLINSLIQKFLGPILSMVSEWVNGFIVYLGKFINEITRRSGSNDTQSLAIKFAKAFFSQQMWTLAMALSIGIVSIVTTLNIVLKAISGGTELIVDPLIKAIAGTLLKYTVMAGITEAALGGIFSIITFFIPHNNPIWNSGVFMSIIGFVQTAINFAINHALVSALPFYLKMPKLEWFDYMGLSIAIGTLILDIMVSTGKIPLNNKWSNLTIALISTIFSAISFFLTLLKDDFIDQFIGGALSYIEEIISGIATVFSSILLGEAIGAVIS